MKLNPMYFVVFGLLAFFSGWVVLGAFFAA